jgi:hypothetical protein
VPFCAHLSAVWEPSKWQQTFWYPEVFIISCMALYPMPSCDMITLKVTLQSCVMSTSTFCSLHSMVAVLGGPLQGRSMSLFPSLKCFSQHHILMEPMQESPKTWSRSSEVFVAKLFLFRRNKITACRQNDTSFTATLWQWFIDNY